jgi:hypothetical protein
METEYLDEEQVIALYNKVRTGKRTWPTGIWTSPAALQYAVTVFDYWIHNVMGWKGWPEARGKVTPALLEEHRLADLVESVFVPEFGDDWLDFEIVLNESMRLSEDEAWAPDVADRQERVESAFEHAEAAAQAAFDIPPFPQSPAAHVERIPGGSSRARQGGAGAGRAVLGPAAAGSQHARAGRRGLVDRQRG